MAQCVVYPSTAAFSFISSPLGDELTRLQIVCDDELAMRGACAWKELGIKLSAGGRSRNSPSTWLGLGGEYQNKTAPRLDFYLAPVSRPSTGNEPAVIWILPACHEWCYWRINADIHLCRDLAIPSAARSCDPRSGRSCILLMLCISYCFERYCAVQYKYSYLDSTSRVLLMSAQTSRLILIVFRYLSVRLS
jgi:hypothetical protein